jgi:hypothetical protein
LSQLLLDLEIDAACWEFLTRRIVQMGGTPQPTVTVLDAPPDPDEDWEEVTEPPDPDEDWEELTARAAKYMPEPGQETVVEQVERVLGKNRDLTNA